jgi:hypothetical protein
LEFALLEHTLMMLKLGYFEITKKLILLLDMPNNYNIFFHGCHYFFSRCKHIYKVKNKDKKQTKKCRLNGGSLFKLSSAQKQPKLHDFLIKTRTRACLILNTNHETKKKKKKNKNTTCAKQESNKILLQKRNKTKL